MDCDLKTGGGGGAFVAISTLCLAESCGGREKFPGAGGGIAKVAAKLTGGGGMGPGRGATTGGVGIEGGGGGLKANESRAGAGIDPLAD